MIAAQRTTDFHFGVHLFLLIHFLFRLSGVSAACKQVFVTLNVGITKNSATHFKRTSNVDVTQFPPILCRADRRNFESGGWRFEGFIVLGSVENDVKQLKKSLNVDLT